MEFTLDGNYDGARFGCIGVHRSPVNIDQKSKELRSHENVNGPKITQNTPAFMVYTRYGRIPNLTTDVAEYVQDLPNLNRMRLCELMEESVATSLKALGKTYQDFTNKDGAVFFCSVQDVAVFNKTDVYKYAEDKSISVWTQSGRKKVTAEELMNAAALAGIQCIEALCDIVPGGESSKRCRKSVERTLKYLDKCISIKNENLSKFGSISLFGAIVGGDDIQERQRSTQETIKRNVQGFVLEGYDQLGESWMDILKPTLLDLPKNKPRILFGSFKPDQIIDGISCGVDIVDSSYVNDISERGYAAVFEYRSKRHKHISALTTATTNCGIEQSAESENLEFEIDLNDKKYKEDFRSILEDCSCYTCLNYTRVYLNHLLTTNEMLAQVLLTVHNMHHFVGFMSEVRSAARSGSLQQLRTDLLRTKHS